MAGAVADLANLKEVQKQLNAGRKKYPQAYDHFTELVKSNKMIGYKNICKMLQGVTPEELKEGKTGK